MSNLLNRHLFDIIFDYQIQNKLIQSKYCPKSPIYAICGVIKYTPTSRPSHSLECPIFLFHLLFFLDY